MSPDEFRKALERENIPYAKYREDIRNEMHRCSACASARSTARSASPTPRSINYLATLEAQTGGESEYRARAHARDRCPSRRAPTRSRRGASAPRRRCAQIRGGAGLRPGRRGIFRRAGRAAGRQSRLAHAGAAADGVRRRVREHEGRRRLGRAAQRRPVSTSSSCSRSAAATSATVVDQTHARHILIKVNELTSEAEAKVKIDRMRSASTAAPSSTIWRKLNSEDASARQGRRPRLAVAGRHRARFRGSDEQARS